MGWPLENPPHRTRLAEAAHAPARNELRRLRKETARIQARIDDTFEV